MTYIKLVFVALFFSSTAVASGPDCIPGEIRHFKVKEVNEHGLFLGRFSCTTHYWDANKNYYIGDIDERTYNVRLRGVNELDSCKPIERASYVRWNDYKDTGLPVKATYQVFEKKALDAKCEPAQTVGYSCMFYLYFKGFNLDFKSQEYMINGLNQQKKCEDIFGKLWQP